MENIIQQYLESILTEAGLDGMPEGFKQEYFEKLEEEITKRLGVVALRAMDDQTLDQFDALISEHPELPAEKVISFYQEHIPNFIDKVQNALMDFKTEFVNRAKAMSDSASSSQ